MNNIAMALAVQKAVKPRFRGHSNILPRMAMQYPTSLEREYVRLTNTYMALLNSSLSEHLPTLRRAIDNARAKMRYDDFDEFGYHGMDDLIVGVFARIRRDFQHRSQRYQLERRILAVSTQLRNFSVSQWRRLVRNTLGVNILEDYYKGEFFRHSIGQWVNRNVNLITSVPQETLTELRTIIQSGWQQGTHNRVISKQIEAVYNVKKRKAEFWARDQVSKLNAEITQQQQKDAGVQEYVWSTSKDERVRGNPSGLWPEGKHYGFNGKRFSWAEPPEVAPGRNCHPGEDYRCRCVALPVFNLPNLSLPWERGESE